MSAKADTIMDGLTVRTQEIMDKQTEAATTMLAGANPHQDDAWLWVLMVEAHKAGIDPIYAKTAYLKGDIEAVDVEDRITRLTGAIIYAGEWSIKRGIAL
ncbi:hypothetical protein AX777_05950 [Sphingobium yanoikuyae]|uniref:Uncharacterized protein n=1 Tax=Sphingobium yanoikuyae TaxID=13690 RepID=A0A177JNG0_SPHYA|nr:hypothetical protein [Sphingobium yanoikuyae]OAH42780.1 hypothetical protein AX777_05950 [Sphingobium yanoikuyae]